MTGRRYIANLEASGHVVAVQGGVRLAENSGTQPPAAAADVTAFVTRPRIRYY